MTRETFTKRLAEIEKPQHTSFRSKSEHISDMYLQMLRTDRCVISASRTKSGKEEVIENNV